MYRVLFVISALVLIGCTEKSASTAVQPMKQGKLPPEIEGRPEDAIKATKKTPIRLKQ